MKKYLLFCIICISQIFAGLIHPLDVSVVIYDSTQYAKGNTIFGSADGTYSAIIDMYGNEIWNSGNESLIYYNYSDVTISELDQSTENVKLFSARYCPECPYNYISNKFSLIEPTGATILWEEPNLEYAHHEFVELPWGDYMGIVHEYQNGPVPPNPFDPAFLDFNCTPNWTDYCWPWQGDKLVIWDSDTKDVRWSWSTFDHYNINDYDANEWNVNPVDFENGETIPFDWTHVNAFYFDARDSTILISSRNLSRITKIQYPSGDVIWNMGHEIISPITGSTSGDVTFGKDLGFSRQHYVSLTDEDNIIIFDNGNYAPEFWGADEPTSRALEITVLDLLGNYSAAIVWEYILPDDLFSFTSGNVQKLQNGNYLITSVGDQGNTLEVVPTSSETGDIIWKAHYASEAMYRASRLPCLSAIGNISGDGAWNVQDIVQLANCVLADNCATNQYSCAGDVNQDSLWNVQDIVQLANCILSNSCASFFSS